MIKRRPLIQYLSQIVLIVLLASGVGCATPGGKDERPAKPAHLEMIARDFHTNLRWGRFEHASGAVHEAYLQSFMGRYEELGKDFRIVDMTMKSAELKDDGFEAIIEVDQEWYQLPDTSVQEARYVERWVSVEGTWKLRERLTRDEYRELGKVFPSEESEREAKRAQEEVAADEEPAGDDEHR